MFILFFLISFFSVQALENRPFFFSDPLEPQTGSRPFRAGILRFSPTTDAEKPLAVSDPGGWVIAEDIIVGSFERKILGAKSLTTGRILWWYNLDQDITAPIAQFGTGILVATRGGKVEKLDLLTGKKAWEVTLESFVARPFTLSGSVVVAVSVGQVIYSIDFQSGRQNWLFDAGFPENLVLRTSAAAVIAGGEVLIGTASGEIISLSLATGKQEWKTNPLYTESRFKDVIGEMVVVNSRLIFARYDGLVGAIQLSGTDKSLVWKESYPSLATSRYRGGKYFVGSVAGDVSALDSQDGKMLWRTSTGQTVSSMVIGETNIVTVGSSGRIHNLNIGDGRLEWHDDVGGDVSSPMTLARDFLYVPTSLRNVYVYRIKKD